MHIHFIAIGGSAMHNLAIALKQKGETVTGSDDDIFEPSYSRLKQHDILPAEMGWNPDHIQPNIDLVILGMHAKPDNPELKKAQELGLKIYSYPEFLYEHSKKQNPSCHSRFARQNDHYLNDFTCFKLSQQTHRFYGRCTT